jgi:MraZ protein
MPVWLALEERLSRAPSTHPSRTKFLDRVNYYGQNAEIDGQGRVLIHQRLRESAGMAGEVDVLGTVDRLDVWNHDRLVAKMLSDPYTDDDARALSEFGI